MTESNWEIGGELDKGLFELRAGCGDCNELGVRAGANSISGRGRMRGEEVPGAGEGQPRRGWESQLGTRYLEEHGSPIPEQGVIYYQMLWEGGTGAVLG